MILGTCTSPMVSISPTKNQCLACENSMGNVFCSKWKGIVVHSLCEASCYARGCSSPMYHPRRLGQDFHPRGTQFIWDSGVSVFCVLGNVPNWDSGQTQSPSSLWLWSPQSLSFLGPKVRIQTHGSLKYAFWDTISQSLTTFLVPLSPAVMLLYLP